MTNLKQITAIVEAQRVAAERERELAVALHAKAEAIIAECGDRADAHRRVATLRDWVAVGVARVNALEARNDEHRNEIAELEAALARTA